MRWQHLNGSAVVGMELDDTLGMATLRLRMESLCTFDAQTPTNGRHAHTNWEVCLVTDGTGEFHHGDTMYPVQPGDLFVADPHVTHEIRLSPARAPYTDHALRLYFFQAQVDTSDDGGATWEEQVIVDFLRGHHSIRGQQDRLCCYLDFFAQYRPQGDRESYGLRQSAKSFALECLAALVTDRRTPPDRQSYPAPLDRALTYITMHLGQRMRVEEIAAAACTSPRNVQQLFRRYLHTTVIGFINARRMQVAASHLRMHFSIAETADQVGIGDAARFSRLFRQYHGCSPKQYQIMHARGGVPFGLATPLDAAPARVPSVQGETSR